MTYLEHCAAPAKLNLFLHVVGRRPDGYHLLQSVFRLLDWHDTLNFRRSPSAHIHLANPIPGVADEHNLCVRAARLLQQATGCTKGAEIELIKRLPMGGGLGGGSSDAATTLISLNRLWNTGLSRLQLAQIGVQLGADIPFFIHGEDAFVEGIGELITSIKLDPAHYVVIAPQVEVPTAQIFSSPELTRNTKTTTIAVFATQQTRNDLQPVACKLFPEVAAVVEWLSQHAPARMTGSGACVFAQVDDKITAQRIIESCPPQWRAWQAGSIARHPLYNWSS